MSPSGSKSDNIAGSCLCGRVSYEISGKVGDIVHCHCKTCRKAHGAAFSSVAAVNDSDFTIAGSEHLNAFESSTGKWRYLVLWMMIHKLVRKTTSGFLNKLTGIQ